MSPPANEPNLDELSRIANSSSVTLLANVLGSDAELHLVGGTVRDLLSGVAATDLDLATTLHPTRVSELLTAANIRVIPTGIEHGTITALVDNTPIEITTFRTPGSRRVFLPSSSIEEDLLGRDFTINAIAFAVASHTLVDPLNGLSDLRAGIVRGVADPAARFEEDPLRIIRLVRFGPAVGRAIDPATLVAAKQLVEKLTTISQERIRDELIKIILATHARRGFEALLDIGILQQILPEFIPTVGCEQNEFHIEDVFQHTLSVLDRCPRDNRRLRLTAVFHDLGKPHTVSVGDDGRRHFYLHEKVSAELCKQIMDRLHFPHRERDEVALLVATHMRPISCGPAGARRLMRELGDTFSDWRQFKWADQSPALDPKLFDAEAKTFDELVANEKIRLANSSGGRLAINGDDLIALGMAPGPKLGEILKTLSDEVLENPDLNERKVLLERATELLSQSNVK